MSKYCANCGEELVDSAKFCRNCGTPLNVNVESNTTQNSFTPQVVEKDYTWLFILGIVLSLIFTLLGIIAGIVLYTRKNAANPKAKGAFVIAIGVIVWILSLTVLRLM